MASIVRGGQPVRRVGISCCSNRRWLRDVRLTPGSRRLQSHKDNDQWTFSVGSIIQHQGGRPMSYPSLASVLTQVRHTKTVCESRSCYTSRSRYVLTFPLSCTVHPLSSTDAEPDASADAPPLSPAARAPTPDFLPFYSVFACSNCSSLVSCLPTSPSSSLSLSLRFPASSQTTCSRVRVTSGIMTSTLPAESVPLSAASLTSYVQEAGGELQQIAKKHHLCSVGAPVAMGLSPRSRCSDRQELLNTQIPCSLTLDLHTYSRMPAHQGSVLPVYYIGTVRPQGTTRYCPHIQVATSRSWALRPYCTAVTLTLPRCAESTSSPVRKIKAPAPRSAARAGHTAAARAAAPTPHLQLSLDDRSSLDFWGVQITSTKGNRSRSRSYEVLNGWWWTAIGTRNSSKLSHLLIKDDAAGGETMCSADLCKTWGCERFVPKGVGGEMQPDFTSTHVGLDCRCKVIGRKALRVSDSSDCLKTVPVAAAAVPVSLERSSSSLKEEVHTRGAVERIEPPSEALQRAAMSHAPPSATEEAEVVLPLGNSSCVHPPDDGSYAAVLQAKIQAQTAGWAADSTLVNCITDFLLAFKTAIDVPWAIALPLLGGALRLATLPFAVSSERDIRLRAVYGEEMRMLQMAAEKAKANGFASPEFKKAQKKLKSFLKTRNLSLIPLSIFQVLLIGLVISLTTPAIRNEFPQFTMEHPAWVESLAVPDPTPLTAFVSTYGMLSLILAGWLVSDKIAKSRPQQRSSSSPFLTRVIPGIIASCVTIYAGVYFPVGAMYMLLPAAGVQAIFTRIFRLRAVERTLNLLPDSVKPLHLVYSEALRYRAPKVFQEWQRELEAKNSTPREIQKHVLLLWRQRMDRDYWSSSPLTRYHGQIKGAKL